jgi:hypothetical protein
MYTQKEKKMGIEPPSTTTILSQDSVHAIMTTVLPHFIYVNVLLVVLMMYYHMNKQNIANDFISQLQDLRK